MVEKMIINRVLIWIVSLCCLFDIGGCASSPPKQYPRHRNKIVVQRPVDQDRLSKAIAYWMGTPHKLGGTSKEGIDCSALVQRIYLSVYGIKLPRSTKEQMKIGRAIPKRKLTRGDLVFFKTGFSKRHVGIYIGDGRFVHTSSKRGVMISQLNSLYWKKCYQHARRVNR